jgi:hypothetical protein
MAKWLFFITISLALLIFFDFSGDLKEEFSVQSEFDQNIINDPELHASLQKVVNVSARDIATVEELATSDSSSESFKSQNEYSGPDLNIATFEMEVKEIKSIEHLFSLRESLTMDVQNLNSYLAEGENYTSSEQYNVFRDNLEDVEMKLQVVEARIKEHEYLLVEESANPENQHDEVTNDKNQNLGFHP